MKVSKHARREAKQLYRSCLLSGLLDEDRARQVADRLLEVKPRGYFAILTYLHRLLQLDAGRRLARIESAVPLSPENQTAIKANLQHRYGPGLNFNFSHVPALLGGVRVQVGSDVYDGSIRARLSEVEQAFESA